MTVYRTHTRRRAALALALSVGLLTAACDDGEGSTSADTDTRVTGDTVSDAASDVTPEDALDADTRAPDTSTPADSRGSDVRDTSQSGDSDTLQPPDDNPWTCDLFQCADVQGETVEVSAGDDLQTALDQASPGDTLLLEAGATFTGNFVLRASSDSSGACITVRTATPDEVLPRGVRVTPGDASKLARLVSPGGGQPVLRAEPSAHHYRLLGLELMPESADAEVFEIVALGTSGAAQDSLDEVPHHLLVDRSWIHGWPDANFKRGIGLNAADACVLNSRIDEIHSDFQDSQAIGGFNGPGPFRIYNNRLEGAAENIMFGGAVPAIDQLTPTDIEVRGNHFFKPLAWKAGHPDNTGYTPWVKNLFELKHARDVVLSGNILENNWVGADQHGVAVVLTPRSEGGQVPWAVVENVTIENNIFRHVGGGVAILGEDTNGSSQQTKGIVVRNNLFEDIRQDYALDIVRVFQFTGIDGLTVDHNTFVYAAGSWPVLRTYGDPTTGFAYTNNVVEFREGLWSDCGTNADAVSCKLSDGEVAGNVFIGGDGATFVSKNYWPATIDDVGFVDYAGGASDFTGYALSTDSTYAGNATDGTSPGIDAMAIEDALAGR